MGQDSSLCVSAVVLTLGSVDIEDGVPGREQVECGREEVEDGEKQERETDKEQPTNAHFGFGHENPKILFKCIQWY